MDITLSMATIGGKKIKDMRLTDLQTELENRGLEKTGLKAELIHRLKTAVESESEFVDISNSNEEAVNLSQRPLESGCQVSVDDSSQSSSCQTALQENDNTISRYEFDQLKTDFEAFKADFKRRAHNQSTEDLNSAICKSTTLQFENDELKRQLTELQIRNNALQKELNHIRDENRGLITTIKLLSSPKERSEHPLPKGGDTDVSPNLQNNSNSVTETQHEAPKIMLTSSKDRSLENSSTEPTQILIIGDSIIKHIDPKKLSQKPINKITHPGKTSDEIAKAVSELKMTKEPSHVIIHAGTNDLPMASAQECTAKIKNLVAAVKSKFSNSKLGVSSLTHREDINVSSKIADVNNELKAVSSNMDFTFIDNSVIDSSSLNGSKLHLNSKGSALLASQFIKFLRAGRPPLREQDFHQDKIQQQSKVLLELYSTKPMPRDRRDRRSTQANRRNSR